jgi:DNA polymerase III subunit gamma/tau
LFENLIGQESVRDQLENARNNHSLPKALHFTGEAHSGKLSAALELARGITCKNGKALWDCDCRSCRDHRLLVHPDILLLGSRYFMAEIKASADLLMRTKAVFAQYMFIRNIRKLLKRFEPTIWEGMEKKLSRYSSSLSRIAENVEQLDPGKVLPEDDELKELLDDTVNLARNLVPAVPGVTPVDQIRNISKWAHLTSAGSAKIVILEQIDKMLESASNSLLKILEEPPAHVTFILLSERKGTIIPTILSRVRTYQFLPRTRETSSLVLEKLFRKEQKDLLLYEFFQEWSDVDYVFLKDHVRTFADNVFTKGSVTDLDDLFQFIDNNRNKAVLGSFLRLLSEEVRMRFREDPELQGSVTGQQVMKDIMSEINRSHISSEIYNQNSLFLLECLFYKTRDIYEALC